MHFTIELLISGDQNVNKYYQAAVERWKDIWSRPASTEVIDLATMLSREQAWFEHHCGTRWIGQEIMVVSGFGMLYSTRVGFADQVEQAQLLYDAFQRSMCSIEVKVIARDMAESYRLFEKSTA
ncbi:MAG: hypothetical protein ABI353_23995 [Isosphaeraceae bacterium]